MSQILIIEDSITDATKLTALLTGLHYQTRIVDTRAKAEEYIALKQFDAIITNSVLPDGTYQDILRFMNRRPNYGYVPIVVLSHAISSSTTQKMRLEGVKYIFQYPISNTVLEQMNNAFDYNVAYSYPSELTGIIDMNSTLKIHCDKLMTTQLFDMLAEVLSNDKQQLEQSYDTNDLDTINHILDRLEGTFQCCIVPALSLAHKNLYQELKETSDLSSSAILFNIFFEEIERFLTTYEKLRLQIYTTL